MKFSLKDLFYAVTYASLGLLCLGIYIRLRGEVGDEFGIPLLLLTGPLLGRAIGGLIGKPELTYLGAFIAFFATLLHPAIRH